MTAPDILPIDKQRDLVADAHRAGLTSLSVVMLIDDETGRLLLVDGGWTDHAAAQRWTLPFTDVLPGELICDAVDRLCCQILHLGCSEQPVGFLWPSPLHESGVMTYAFTLPAGRPRPLFDDIGTHQWWDPTDSQRLDLDATARQILSSLYVLPPALTPQDGQFTGPPRQLTLHPGRDGSR